MVGRNYFLMGSCFDIPVFLILVFVIPVFLRSDFYDLNIS
jgi:hypothetical protein